MAHLCMPNSLLCLLITFTIFASCISIAQTKPTSVFIFGDSTSDVGTNNYIPNTNFKANHTPFGINYPGGRATGRWSDGYITIDYLCKYMLGYEESPEPYAALQQQKNPDYSKGINFASAGAGLLDSSSYGERGVAPILAQTKQFESVLEKIAEAADIRDGAGYYKWMSKAIFLISVGSNDIIMFGDEYATLGDDAKKKALVEYPIHLTTGTKILIETLYSLGARRFGVISVLAIGCVPHMRAKDETRECSLSNNTMSTMYMVGLKVELKKLQIKYKDLKYSFGDTRSMMGIVMNREIETGLDYVDKACCEDGCSVTQKPCKNPEEHAFWDDFHPTDAASKVMAKALYEGTEESVGIQLVNPITFKQLAEEGYEDDESDAMLMEA